MKDYFNNKIYKITSDSRPDLIYYGSTCNSLCKRFSQHKSMSNGSTSKQILDLGDAKIHLVELFPCHCKEEAYAKEAEYINNNVCVNTKIPGQNRLRFINGVLNIDEDYGKQSYCDNVKQSIYRYRLKNPDKIKQQAKKDYMTQKAKPDFKLKQNAYIQRRKEKKANREVIATMFMSVI